MVRRAKAVAQAIIDGSRDMPRAAREETIKFALRSEAAPRIAAMLELAKSEPGITIAARLLDSDPWIVGVQRGAFDLRSGEFILPAAMAYVSRQLGTDYRSHADCPTWLAFLDRVMAGDIDLIGFIQRAVGYSLTGSTREQCIFILHGPGANGKTVFLRVVRLLLGEYGADATIDTFLDRRGRESSNDIARLAGVRLVVASEIDEGRSLAEGLVKSLTGGDAVSARLLYREYFEFLPVFKIWFGVNHKPRIRGDDHAIWRRIRLVPFRVTIPDAEQDRDLLDKLRRELPGILRWAIEGARAWQEVGLCPPAAVDMATEEYRAEFDTLRDWLLEACLQRDGAAAQAKLLYDSYRAFVEARGASALSMRRWGQRMVEHGFEKRDGRSATRSGVVVYHGIGLRDLCDSGDQLSGTSLYPPSRGDFPEKARQGRQGRTEYEDTSRGE
jgi:putative DNA primase/helicase